MPVPWMRVWGILAVVLCLVSLWGVAQVWSAIIVFPR